MPLSRCPGPRLARRTLLQAGACSWLRSALPGILRSRATSATFSGPKKVRAVLLAHTSGGPSHLDALDPKPDAPPEIRGSFGTIPTALPGVRYSEHLPLLACCLDRM